jgi:hypothetical protein
MYNLQCTIIIKTPKTQIRQQVTVQTHHHLDLTIYDRTLI